MAKIITLCPHCHQEIEADDSMINLNAVCPYCEKEFTISPPAPEEKEPQKQENGKKENYFSKLLASIKINFKSDYPWGRLYILLAHLLAVLLLVNAIVVCVIICKNTIQARAELQSQIEEQSIPLIQQQDSFAKGYLENANLLLSGNQSKAKFKIPANILQQTKCFNASLLTTEDAAESLAAAAEYENHLNQASQAIQQYFIKQLAGIDKKLRQGDPLHYRKQYGRQINTNLIIDMTKKVDFYIFPSADLARRFKNQDAPINKLQHSSAGDAIKTELATIESGLDFIRTSLCSEQNVRKIQGTQTNVQERMEQVGEEKMLYEKKLLAILSGELEPLCICDNWKIACQLKELQKSLLTHKKLIDQISKQRKVLLTQAGELILIVLLISVILSFFIMILADFFRAHFDAADHLAKLVKRSGCLLILLMLGLAGCDGNLAAMLEQDKPQLEQAITNNYFQKLLQDNPDAEFFGDGKKELVIFAGGLISYNQPTEDFKLMEAKQIYNIYRFKIDSIAITFNPIQKRKSGQYTHSSMLMANIKITIINGADISGLTVQWLTPEGFSALSSSQREKWYKEKLASMPPADLNPAIAIAGCSQSETTTQTLNLMIRYNNSTGHWELEQPVELPQFNAIPVAAPEAIRQLYRKSHFEPFEWTLTPPHKQLHLWSADLDTVKKINDGMIKYKGIWKYEIVVRHTEQLQNLCLNMKKKQTLNHEDLIQLARLISQSERAECLGDAKKYCQHLIQELFIKRHQQQREFLVSVRKMLQENDCFNVIDRQMLIDLCQKNIDRIDDAKRADIAQFKKDLEAVRDAILNDFTQVYPQADKIGLTKVEKFNAYYNGILQLNRIKAKNAAAMKQLIAAEWVFKTADNEYELSTVCKKCSGNGKASCTECKNTGICRICKGTGQKTVHENSFGGTGLNSRAVSAPCPEKCQTCRGQTKPCPACRGNKGFLNQQNVREAIQSEKQAFANWISPFIQSGTMPR